LRELEVGRRDVDGFVLHRVETGIVEVEEPQQHHPRQGFGTRRGLLRPARDGCCDEQAQRSDFRE